MSLLGTTMRIKGEVQSTADLTIDCHVTGPVTCEGGVVTIAKTAVVAGDVVAGDITVFGRASGQLIATDVVDIRPAADVAAVVIAPKLILHDGAHLTGRVEPHRLDAALSVAKFQKRQRA